MSEKIRNLNGYKVIYKEGHPNSMTSENWNGWIYEHIYLMSEHIGRPLNEDEVVHHLDENKSNNKLENLVLLTAEAHNKIHGMLYKSTNKNNSKCVDIEDALDIFDIKINNIENKKKLINYYKSLNKSIAISYCKNENCKKPLLKGQAVFCSKECEKLVKPASLPYNTEELQELADSYSYTEIGRMYGISDNAAKKHMQRYGVELKKKKSRNDLSDIKDKEKLKEMINSGRTLKSICEEYGCAIKTLRNYLNQFGIEYKTSQEINASKLSKKVNQYDKNGNLINSFNSVKEAEKYLGYEKGKTKISECCNGKRKSCLGYVWKYA